MTKREVVRALAAASIGVVAASQLAAAQEALTRMSVDANGVEGNADSGRFTVHIGGGDSGIGLPDFEYFSPTSMSADGRYVAFDSRATNLVADGNPGLSVFIQDRASGEIVRLHSGLLDYFGYEAWCEWPSISSDRRFVAFQTHDWSAYGYITQQIYVHDRDPDENGVFDEGNGVTTEVSVDSSGVEGDGGSWSPSISGDGKRIVFESVSTNLVADDTNGAPDIFLHDLPTAQTTRVSVDSTGLEADYGGEFPVISADGATVAFSSWADNLVSNDSNGVSDIFVRDLLTGTTSRVSVDSTGVEGNGDSFGGSGFVVAWEGGPAGISLSSDGSVVAFASYADNLVAGDMNSAADVFVHDRTSGTTERMSVDFSGAEGNADSWSAALSADGQVVAFQSSASDLTLADTNFAFDVFVHDRTSGATTLMSANCGVAGSSHSRSPSLSADGQFVAFSSFASDLVDGDTNGANDVFVRDRSIADPDASWANYGTGFPGTFGEPILTSSADPVLGTTITLDVGNSLGFWTVGFLLIGADDASIPTNLGGTLLVIPSLVLPLALGPAGGSFAVDIPADPALCELSAYFQTLELDPGAARGASFTPGLQLSFGH
jgi:Tol biopolymer transport system component